MENDERDSMLRDENRFLKMKLMLERGAIINCDPDDSIPPEVENEFLNSIVRLEKQFEEGKMITVFEKVGSPGHFVPHTEISDDRIGDAWKELDEHLLSHQVSLDSYPGSITPRELYRFVTEELFREDIIDFMENMVTGFIYTEFYPDQSLRGNENGS